MEGNEPVLHACSCGGEGRGGLRSSEVALSEARADAGNAALAREEAARHAGQVEAIERQLAALHP